MLLAATTDARAGQACDLPVIQRDRHARDAVHKFLNLELQIRGRGVPLSAIGDRAVISITAIDR